MGCITQGACAVVVAVLAAAPAHAADPVVAAAGDIACDPASPSFNGGDGDATRCHQKATAGLLGSGPLAAVLPLGDVQYEEGTLAQFQGSYDLTWGAYNSIAHPVVGNHEYFNGSGDPLGSGYFDYFNGVGNFTGPAGDRDKGYYSFDIGGWHLVALNSVCQQVGGCSAGSAQEQWLRADLAANASACTLAYWHHPFFNSGPAGSYTGTRDLWQALYEDGAELVLNGHAHSYERFARQDPDGNADATYGIRELVVGTGGKSLGSFGTVQPNSQVRDNQSFGVLELTLHPSSYDWRFVRESGAAGDSGSSSCHDAPPLRAPSAVTGPATAVTETSATVNAAVNPRRQATNYRFEYGPSAGYGSVTAEREAGLVNSANQQVAAELPGLEPGTTYHYRVLATNGTGTAAGEDRTFQTGGATAPYARMVVETPGLSSYWRLGEPDGPFGFDQRGLKLGSFVGGYALGQAGAIAGDADGAVSFDGVNAELEAAGPVVSASATIEGWFLWHQGVAVMRDDSWSAGWILAYENTSGNLGYRVAGKIFSTGRPVAVVRDGAWHHLAVTKEGANVALYLDGQRLHAGTGAGNSPAAAPWHLMRNGQNPEYAQGLADEVAVYDTALPAEAIHRRFDAGDGVEGDDPPPGATPPADAPPPPTGDEPAVESPTPGQPPPDAPPVEEPTTTGTVPPPPATASYRVAGYRIRAGRVLRGRGGLGRLHRDDGARLEVAAARTRSGYVADLLTHASIGRERRRALRTLRLTYDGGASSGRGAAVVLRVYNYWTQRWVAITGARTRLRPDRRVTWRPSRYPRDYVSARGTFRLRVTGRSRSPFRTRTDLIRLTVG